MLKFIKYNKNYFNFYFDLNKECFKDYVIRYFGKWEDEDQNIRIKKNLKENGKTLKIIKLNKEPIGYFNFFKEDDHIFFSLLCLKKEYRNSGIGGKIIKDLLNDAKNNKLKVKLKVFKNNPAQNLYKKMNFEIYHEDDNYYYMERKF